MPTVSIYNQPLTPSPDIWNVAPPRDPLSASLVSYWELDEASGTRIDSNDLNKNHLTDNNTVGQAVGKVGNAAQFNSLSSRSLTRASNASLQTGDIDQTICAWVYLDSKPATTMRIAGKTDNTTGAGYAIDWQNTADRFSFRMWQAGGGASLNAIASHFGAPALSTWYFVVARFDSVSGNGIITVNDGTKSATAKSASPGSDTVAFAIGANGDGTAFFDGRIDQVGLWKRYLTDTEVTFLYNNGAGRTYAEVNGALLQTANIVSISAPDVPGVDLTMPQTVNTVTVTAPAQSQLVDSPLSAGANTITVTAPTVPSLALTMPQTANVVTVTAPTVPSVALTMPQTANVVAVTAPTVPSLALTMPQTANIVTISAPTAVGVFAAPSLAAGANTITVTAPTVPSLALTMPQTANTITVTAPAQSQLVAITLAAGANTVTVTAPAQSQLVAITLAAGANTVTVTAPAQSQLVAVTLAAGANTITVTAPAQTELHAVTLIASGVGEGTESFTDTDGVALATHSGAWTVQNGNFDIKSNALTVNNGASAFNYAHRNDFTPADIQYAKARIVAVSGESYIGVSVRAAVAAQTSYNYYSNNGTRFFFKTVAEAITIFGSGGPFAANDVIELRAIGDQITPYLNGVIDSAVGGTVTDASITSGRVGVSAFQSTVGTATQLDDWEGGSYRPPLTVTVTAPAQSQLVAITLAAGANTVTVTAPVATLVIAGVDLTAGVNAVTISAPTVPSLALTMPQTANTVTVTAPGATGVFDGGPLTAGANTITVTAPAQSQLATVTLAAGANTVTVSAPAQSQLVAITLASGQNAITVTAPLVPSVHLTMPIGTNTITVSAPAQSQIVEKFLAAGANTITVSAPTQSQLVAITLAGGQNTVAVSAPTSLLLVAQAAAAGQNTVLVTAPDAGILVTFDVVLELGPNVVTILAPTITFQPQYFGDTVKEYMVYVPIEAPRTVKI